MVRKYLAQRASLGQAAVLRGSALDACSNCQVKAIHHKIGCHKQKTAESSIQPQEVPLDTIPQHHELPEKVSLDS
eukprot:6209288-Amphidinium_carterae.1